MMACSSPHCSRWGLASQRPVWALLQQALLMSSRSDSCLLPVGPNHKQTPLQRYRRPPRQWAEDQLDNQLQVLTVPALPADPLDGSAAIRWPCQVSWPLARADPHSARGGPESFVARTAAQTDAHPPWPGHSVGSQRSDHRLHGEATTREGTCTGLGTPLNPCGNGHIGSRSHMN